MFFLKKFISAFLMPLPIFLFVFALGVYFLYKNSYNKAKIVLFFALSWISLLSFQPISNALLEPLESSHKPLLHTPKNIKYVLVLGAGHSSNEYLPLTSQIGMTAQNRLNEGIRHYRNLKNAKLIVSGGKIYDKNSHAFMQTLMAKSLGVNEKNILRLEKPRDTHEEALAMKKLVGNEKFILVTSASHMKRSSKLFKKQGLNFIEAPTNHLARESKSFSSFFSAFNLYKTKIAFHEYLGLIYSYIKGII